ncbi:MAG: SpoIIE family protein phosphatase [Acidobacteriia bacterium]|nr:SpoIIE family protein phosphatase [Terriglobia bacterium]
MASPLARRAAAAALALGVACVAVAQEPKPARLGPQNFRDDATVEMTLAWRFHPGDDGSFADPALDDSAWAPFDPVRLTGAAAAAAWQGEGWFRRHLTVDPSLFDTPLTVRVEAPGIAEVFLDGAPLLRAGGGAASQGPGAGTNQGAWQTVRLAGWASHVLAVRYSYLPSAPAGTATDPGFRLSLDVEGAAARRLVAGRRDTVTAIVFITMPASLALLHLALFWAYPRARENLFYALWMTAFSGVVLCNTLSRELASEAGRDLAVRITIPVVLAAIFSVLLTYYSVRTRPFPRSWRFFAAAAAALAVVAFLEPGTVAAWTWYLFFGAVTLEVARVERSGRALPREGFGILLWALLAQFAAVGLVVLSNFGLVPTVMGNNMYLIALVPLAVGMSVFLARSFARTNLDLERRLGEVQSLSDQVLAQERAAHAQELRQRLLEAEHARTEAEVEAARSLQLSMLPSALPSVPGLEVAAAMLTASEVGGDYYDFRVDPEGALVVALGDATGHGVAAGIMVTAVKALFASQRGPARLGPMIAECNRVLRSMNLRPLHMCLTLARVTPRSVTACCAAMPPVLIHRAASGAVEELGKGGLPLGSHLGEAWEEQSAPLGPGDTLLFASDGFFELQDPAGAALGFDGAARALRETVGVPSAEVVDRLSAVAAAWRGAAPQSDDLTLVVVRVTR